MSPRPREEPTFFVDECLGSSVATALRAAGALVEELTDHFDPGTFDEVWLPEIGARGWVVLTKDHRIRTRPEQVLILRRARVRMFILRSQRMTGEAIAARFVEAVPRMRRLVQQRRPPLVAAITASDIRVIEDGGKFGGPKKARPD